MFASLLLPIEKKHQDSQSRKRHREREEENDKESQNKIVPPQKKKQRTDIRPKRSGVHQSHSYNTNTSSPPTTARRFSSTSQSHTDSNYDHTDRELIHHSSQASPRPKRGSYNSTNRNRNGNGSSNISANNNFFDNHHSTTSAKSFNINDQSKHQPEPIQTPENNWSLMKSM